MNDTYVTTCGTRVVSNETAVSLSSSLRRLGSGVSRDCFELDDETVLKIDRDRMGSYAGSCATERAAWQRICGTDAERYVARVLASGDGWLVMERVTDTYGFGNESDEYRELRSVLSRIGIQDLHGANVGTLPDGRLVAIDYAFNSDRENVDSWEDEAHEDENEEWACDCFSHRCVDCFPNGCDCCCSLHRGEDERCETFEGCNVVHCDDCENEARPEFRHFLTFGFARGNMNHDEHGAGFLDGAPRDCCTAHAPRSLVLKARPRPQVAGQIGMLLKARENVLTVPPFLKW